MLLAVVEEGGKQYLVKKGDIIKTEKISGDVGSTVKLQKVLSVGDKIGAPYLPSASIEATILEHKKTEKVIVFKKKRRQNYRRKRGSRQQITVLRITSIA